MLQRTMKSRAAQNGVSPALDLAGRILLGLTACLILVMPWTEYFCSFDRFLRGGPDLELGLLAVASVVCLVLVLLHHAKAVLALSFSIYQRLAYLVRRFALRLPTHPFGKLAAVSASCASERGSTMRSLPMQI